MKTMLLLLTLAKAGDVSTTAIVLHQGGTEQNIFLSSRPALNIAQQAAWTTGEVWVIGRVSRKHPKLAWALAAASIGGSVYGTVHNSREMSHTPSGE